MSKIFEATPFKLEFDIKSTALMMIDMQRDFLEAHGFGALLGNDVSLLRSSIEPCQKVLNAARALGMAVIYTREGHRPDLSDCPPAKLHRGDKVLIGSDGPMGRILVRGEEGHDIIPELYPKSGEVIIDKPGKGAFCATDLGLILKNLGIETLIFCCVTTEVCVQTTMHEANDRGYRCIVAQDCVGSYFPEFQKATLDMISAQGAIVGWVSDSDKICKALSEDA